MFLFLLQVQSLRCQVREWRAGSWVALVDVQPAPRERMLEFGQPYRV